MPEIMLSNYQFDPVHMTKAIVHDAINLLGLAKRVKAKIVEASTSEVYGDSDAPLNRQLFWPRQSMGTARALMTARRSPVSERDFRPVVSDSELRSWAGQRACSQAKPRNKDANENCARCLLVYCCRSFLCSHPKQ
jgi:hypothetical protein